MKTDAEREVALAQKHGFQQLLRMHRKAAVSYGLCPAANEDDLGKKLTKLMDIEGALRRLYDGGDFRTE